jgi:hypothetical protein
LVGRPEGSGTPGRPKSKWEDMVRMSSKCVIGSWSEFMLL